MVRTIQEPIATTPHILRVSTSSATSSRRPSGCSPSQLLFTSSSNTTRSAPRNPSQTTIRRPVLGERSDNLAMPSPSKVRSAIKQKVKIVTRHRASPNKTLTSLSRFVAKSPQLPNFPSSHPPSSSPGMSLASPDMSFTSRPGSTPYVPRVSIPMPMYLREDDTLLLDTRPPELDFSSPGRAMTDDEDDTATMYKGGTIFKGALMTPANSQVIQNGSPQRPDTSTREATPFTSICLPISRLPTPPSSQGDGSSTSLLLPVIESSYRASRVHPRPANTPPRRISTEPALAINNITAEWDTPLRIGEDPSPNPRRKKSPRLDQLGGDEGVTQSRLSSPFEAVDRLEVILPSRLGSSRRSTSTTPASVKAKGKGRTSTSCTPAPTRSHSTTSKSSQQSSGCSNRRTSGGSQKAAAKATPAQKHSRAVPSTAPAAPRRSATPGTTRRRPGSQPPKTVQAKGRRKSSPGTMHGRGKSATPSLNDILSGRKLGFLPEPIHGSPGDDPLLLKGADDISKVGPEFRDGAGLGLDITVQPPFFTSSRLTPIADDHIANNTHFDAASAWSDDGSDDEAVGEDTFIHVLNRREIRSTSTSGLLSQIIPEQGEEDDEEEPRFDETSAAVSNKARSASPYAPPRSPLVDLDHAVAEQSFSEGDVTQDADSSAWDLSVGEMEHLPAESEVVEYPSAPPTSPLADQSRFGEGGNTQHAENPAWDFSDEAIGPIFADLEVKSISHMSPIADVDQGDQSVNDGDTTQEADHSAWNLSIGPIELINVEKENSEGTRSPNPSPPFDQSEPQKDNPFGQHRLCDERDVVDKRGESNVLEKHIVEIPADSSSASPSESDTAIDKLCLGVSVERPLSSSQRATSVPRSPFGLIKNRDSLPLTPVLSTLRCSRSSTASLAATLAVPTIFSRDPNREDAKPVERENIQQYLAHEHETLLSSAEEHLTNSNEIYITAIQQLPDSSQASSPAPFHFGSIKSIGSEEEAEEGSHVGDVTADAESAAWDLSANDINRSRAGDDDSEEEAQEELQAALVGAAEEDEENNQEGEDGHDEDEAANGDGNNAQPTHGDGAVPVEAALSPREAAASPQEIPEKIVLRLVESGVIKLEPETDDEDDVAISNESRPTTPTHYQTPPNEVTINPADSQGGEQDSQSPVTAARFHVSQLTGSPVRSTTPLDSPPPARSTTPSVYPSLTSLSFISTLSHSPPNTNESSTSSSADNVFAVITKSAQPLKSVGSSKLSQEVTSSSPVRSPLPNGDLTFEASEGNEQPESHIDANRKEETDRSVIVRRPRRSLHEELAAFAAHDEECTGDDSFRSVVEVSSLDPKAAARAAAILKLNHAYIERGVLPSSSEGSNINASASSHRRKSMPSNEIDKRELLHEAELELVNSHRRSRSRSLSRARSISVMSFATDDFPVPGGFIKTPAKRKRAQTPLPPMAEHRELEEEQKEHSDRSWGVAEWKRLEKVYRYERQEWVREREVKPMPGGLMAWARRSTMGSYAGAKEWNPERVIDRFLGGEGDPKGLEWERETILLRVQAIERRVSKIDASSQQKSTSIGLTTPVTKRSRHDNQPTLVADQTYEDSSTILQTPHMVNKSVASIEPPSTIRRMLGLVWGRGKEKEAKGQTLISKLEAVNMADKGKRKGTEVLPTTVVMREARSNMISLPNRTTSSPTKRVPPPRPLPPDLNTNANHAFASTKTLVPAASIEITSTPAPKRLYPPLDPPLTQRSSAIAALFPEQDNPTLSTSASALPKSRATAIHQRQRGGSGSVKNLVKSFEDKGFLARSMSRNSEDASKGGSTGSVPRGHE